MQICQYRYNPSEQYQRTGPGMAPESCCGAPTYPAVDEPEIALVQVRYPQDNGEILIADEYRPTGRYLPRAHHDPYCPAHGGTGPPPPPPVSMGELEAAHQAYLELAQRYSEQSGGALTIPVPAPAALAAGSFEDVAAQADLSALTPPVTAGEVQAAAERYAALAAGRAE